MVIASTNKLIRLRRNPTHVHLGDETTSRNFKRLDLGTRYRRQNHSCPFVDRRERNRETLVPIKPELSAEELEARRIKLHQRNLMQNLADDESVDSRINSYEALLSRMHGKPIKLELEPEQETDTTDTYKHPAAFML